MPTRLVQPQPYPAGTASLQITGPTFQRLAGAQDLQISIAQVGPVYLDPRNPDDPWTTAVYRFWPVNQRLEGDALWLDIDYGVTCHLRANLPYTLLLRQEDGVEVEDRFTGSGVIRRPSTVPGGWTPPPNPRGPVAAPVPAIPAQEPAQPVAPEPVLSHAPEPVPSHAPEPVLPGPPIALARPIDPPLPLVGARLVPPPIQIRQAMPAPVEAKGRGAVKVLLVVVLIVLLAAGAIWYLVRGIPSAAPVAGPQAVDPAAATAPPASAAPGSANCSDADQRAGLCRQAQ